MKSRTELNKGYPMFWRDEDRTWEEFLESVEFFDDADWIDAGYTYQSCLDSGCEGCQSRKVILVAEPGKKPRCAYVCCADLGKLKDGYVGDWHTADACGDHVEYTYNKDGKKLSLELNHLVNAQEEHRDVLVPMYGTVIVEFRESDTKTLKRLVEYYIEMFSGPAYTMESIREMV